MERKKRKDAKRDERRSRVAKLYLRNLTTRQIATKIGCTQATVITDLKAIRQQWQEESRVSIAAHKERSLNQIRSVYREAFTAWHHSKKSGDGQARYLQAALAAIAKECQILGIDQPEIDPLEELLAQLPEKFASEVRCELAKLLESEV